jgi:branched-chain amino acid transport system substrate-binding protein
MRKLLLATTAVALSAGAVSAEDIKIGVILGFTGPIESLTPQMGAAAEMAMAEATASGALLGGSTVTSVRGDSTCIDAGAATAVAERLITFRWCQRHHGRRLLWRDRCYFVQRGFG